LRRMRRLVIRLVPRSLSRPKVEKVAPVVSLHSMYGRSPDYGHLFDVRAAWRAER
jgi:hypothetical protein